ncbi:MAG: 30S ribosomal protein S2 [Patescibacteria group bacterium]|nr:MAG: 30S ribosomal protein S2 [Patescibacteria group bacterium]
MSKKISVESPSVADMLEAGMHFGHRTSKWHPKMKPYIFEARKGIHIINLDISREKFQTALDFISQSVAQGKNILLVGTKQQVKQKIQELAEEVGMPYVNQRWLGGTLTNFNVIKNSIRTFRDLTEDQAAGKLEKYTKKEQLQFNRKITKLSKLVGGLSTLNRVPDIIFIWDIKQEKTALTEAKKRGLPIVAICDTNVNPDGIDYIIPGNDDASKTVDLVLAAIKGAIKEAGQRKEEEIKDKE